MSTSLGIKTPLAVLGMATCMIGGVAAAEQAPLMVAAAGDSGGSSASSTPFEEIVVTSQKIAQDPIKVPESISVLTGAALEQQHILTLQDITREVPGFGFNAGNTVSGGTVGPGTSNIVIRGVSSASGSATVALYIDDVSITESNLYDGAAEPKFVDFDRVEVLRGPQGTLFGASSMGGNVRFISKQPSYDTYSGEWDNDLSGTSHGGINFIETLALNIPAIDDKLAFRIAGQIGGNSGYINHYDLAGNLDHAGVNSERWGVVHATAKFQPTDDLTVTAGVFDQGDHTSDTPVFYPQLGTYNQNKQVKEPSNDDLFVPSVTVNEKFDDFDITAITGYFYRDFRFQSDGTAFNDTNLAVNVLDPLYPAQAAEDDAIIGNLPSYVHRENRTYQVSEEIRASSQDATLFGQPLTWIGGLYFEHQRLVRSDYQPSPGLQAAFQQVYGFSINDSLIGPSNFAPNDNVTYANDLIYYDHQWLMQNQYAVFGQAEYSILDNLKIAAGMRYLYATQDYTRDSGGFYTGNTTLNPFFVSTKAYALTPKASITYEITPTDTVYFTAAKGFRLGGPTGPVTSTLCSTELQQSFGISTPPFAYNPDKLWSYEVGTKNRLLNNTVAVNADIYYIDWDNIQQSVNLPICGASITLNVGKAQSYGGELELHAKVAPGLTISLVGGVTRAVITQSPNSLTAGPGQALLNVPKWTATPSVDYRLPLDDMFTGFIQADYDLIGSSHGAFTPLDPAYSQPGYGVLNGAVGVDSDMYRFSLYAKNLLNNSKIITRPSINFLEEGYTLRPLTVGATATINF